jgi:hypothetical protein
LDGAAFARGIPAFERDDAAPPLDPVDLLELEHRDLQFVQFLLIARLVRACAWRSSSAASPGSDETGLSPNASRTLPGTWPPS